MTITVYHGSSTKIKEPLTNVGRNNLDFGQGFYLTNVKEQAEAWAKIAAKRESGDVKPVVNIYRFDYFKTKNIGYRFNEFETYNIEWLNFVVDCRKGKDVGSHYDIIVAAGVNDDNIDIVENYEKGDITEDQAIEQLRRKDIKHQICILNQEIIEYCLEFEDCYELS